MSVDLSTLLSQTEDAISGLLTALAAANCQEYQLPDGRRIKRVEFATALDALRQTRKELRIELRQTTTSPIRVGKLGRPRSVDRHG